MLILMRHGEASWDAPNDESRVLTAQGIAGIQQTVADHVALFRQVKRIVVSPYLRAQQTVNAMMAQWETSLPVVTDSRWTPEADIQTAIASLESHWCEGLLVVTHQPLIGHVISYLLEGNTVHPEPLLPAHFTALTAEWPSAALAQRIHC